MEQEVNKSEELSIEELINKLKFLNYTVLSKYLNKISVEQKLDLLDFLDIWKDYTLFSHILKSLLSSYDNGLLDTYLSTVFHGEKILDKQLILDLGDNHICVETDKSEKNIKFKDISIPKLRQINYQLKLGGVTEEVASSVTKFNEAQLNLLEMQKQLKNIPENTLKNPLVMQQIINNEKIIKELLAGLSEKKDLFNSDLGPLAEKMGWHLHYSGRSPITIGTIQIRDTENKLVEIGGKRSQFQTFKCVYSSDPETIALSELGGVTLKFVDKEKKDQEITWQQYNHDYVKRKEEHYDFIDPEMYDLANTILKKGFSGRIRDFQNKYFVLLTKAGCVFFDDKGNELSDEEGKNRFDKIEIVNGNVVVKGLKKPDRTEKPWITQIRNHRKKPGND